MVSCIWTAITFVSSARIISRLLKLPGPTKLSLQLLSSAETLVCARQSTSVAIKVKN